MRHNILSLVQDLKRIGIKEGDILFLGADLSKIGTIEGKIGEVILNSLLDAVGKEGTLVTIAFSKTFFLPKIDKNYIVDAKTPPYLGALGKLFLAHPDCVRSKHPTNSFLAIGKNANTLLSDHDATKTTYLPLDKLMEMGGKHMLIGCADTQNGLAAIHHSQERLGLSKRSVLSGRIGVYYRDNDKINLFRRYDMGGCSRGFYKFYNELVINNVLMTGYFGDAYSVLADAKASFDIVYRVLEKDPRFALCDDPDCFSCRGTWFYNKRDMPGYYLRNLFKLARKVLKR